MLGHIGNVDHTLVCFDSPPKANMEEKGVKTALLEAQATRKPEMP
jgi:hypothetical protein